MLIKTDLDGNVIFQGITRDKPRWQKCVELTNEEMGMAVGAMFIRENFKKESKDAVSSS